MVLRADGYAGCVSRRLRVVSGELVVGVGLALWSYMKDAPLWVTLLIMTATAAGAFLWVKNAVAVDDEKEESSVGTAFIRGNASDVTATDIYSEADRFVDGDVERSRFHRIRHRPWDGRS
jgi:hypothetical protein